jgi:predicted small lipoprotein YifL
MKKLLIALTGVLLLSGLTGCGTGSSPESDTESQETSGTTESNQTEKGIVAGGMEPSLIEQETKNGKLIYEYIIKNQTENEKTFVFSTGQTIDFEIKDQNGKVVYRDSEGKMYTQAIQEIHVKQGEEFSRKLTLPNLESGTYTLTVWLTAKGGDQYKVQQEITIP